MPLSDILPRQPFQHWSHVIRIQRKSLYLLSSSALRTTATIEHRGFVPFRSSSASKPHSSRSERRPAPLQLSCMERRNGGDVETATPADPAAGLKNQGSDRRNGSSETARLAYSEEDMSGMQTPFKIPGQLVILGVAVLWGTNPPALRYLYSGEGPPSAAAVAGVQASAAAAFLLLLNAALHRTAHRRSRSGWAYRLQVPWEEELQERRGDYSPLSSSEDAAALATEEGLAATEGGRQQDAASRHPDRWLLMSVRGALNASPQRIWLAGAEIGVWAFLANACTVSGFQNTTASKGAFLIRLSAVVTPLIAALAGESVNALVWTGCGAALAGSVLMGASHHSPPGGGPLPVDAAIAPGDALLILAAVMWSLQTVRLGKHARRFPSLPLASVQMLTMAVLSDIWLLGDIGAAVASGKSALSVWEGVSVPLNWAVMVWPSIGPWGVGTALQAAGQTAISSSQTQILLASDPLWATAFAGVLGSGEQDLGAYGWLGGALILAGAILAGVSGGRSRGPDEED